MGQGGEVRWHEAIVIQATRAGHFVTPVTRTVLANVAVESNAAYLLSFPAAVCRL
jgi:hypothetical protein